MQFHTPFRTYRFCILPQGYVNGTAAFFRDMNRSIAKCKELCKQCDNFHPKGIYTNIIPDVNILISYED